MRRREPQRLSDVPKVRQRLLDTMPADARLVFSRRLSNRQFVYLKDAQLLALVDFELTGIGATLNDVGWICTFSDRDAGTVNRANRVAGSGYVD